MEPLIYEDMTLTKADREEIQGWIENGIPGKEHGKLHKFGRKVGKFARAWSLPSIAIGLLVFGLTEWGSYKEFRGATEIRLANVEKALDKIDLKIQASLPQTEFQQTLPDLKTSIKTAREHKTTIPPGTINNLQTKLINTSPSAPDYWPTLSAFISYRSFIAITPSEFSDLTRPGLPNCLDHLPAAGRIISVTKNQLTATNPYYDSCRVTLDSAHDDQVINSIILSVSTSIVFKHCLVVYRGGPVNLIIKLTNFPAAIHTPTMPAQGIPTVVNGNTLFFENCLFELDIMKLPPSPGPEITQALLAENNPGGSVNIPLGPESK